MARQTKRPPEHPVRQYTDTESEGFDLFLRAVGQRVKRFREIAGITRNRMTSLANIKSVYGYIIEEEGQNITLKTLIQISNALNVHPRDLMPETNIAEDIVDENRRLREKLFDMVQLVNRLSTHSKEAQKILDESANGAGLPPRNEKV